MLSRSTARNRRRSRRLASLQSPLAVAPKFAATVPERSNNVSVDYQAMSRASDFLASDALPSVEHWRADETNLGLAKLAAVNLNQMVDHYFHSFSAGASQLLGKTNVGGLRAELLEVKQCSES
jgi:hypothetical protein